MITRIELDGFKTFQDFHLELAPFQVIIGANGAGKSNLFDALRLLSRLAQTSVPDAFRDSNGRGTTREVFSLLPDGRPANQMRLAVELLLDRHTSDESETGPDQETKYRRVRYELVIERRTEERLGEGPRIIHESLTSIPRSKDKWSTRYLGKESARWIETPPKGRARQFISTEVQDRYRSFFAHSESNEKSAMAFSSPVLGRNRTVLSSIGSVPLFAYVSAVQTELAAMHFLLQLEPDVLRLPSEGPVPTRMGYDGRGLAGVLARMAAEDPSLLKDVSRDLSNLVSGILEIKIEKNEDLEEYIIRARTQDAQLFSSRVLSDGTLRMLALVAMKNDPQFMGTLCLEEPENGVHPFRLKNMASLLSKLATDFADPEQSTEPLRQVLINTHSPLLVSELSKSSSHPPVIIFAYMVTHLSGDNQPPRRITRMVPVTADRQLRKALEIPDPEGSYTLLQVLEYLHTVDTGDAGSPLEVASR